MVARDLPLETTSSAAAALWYPYRAYPFERVTAREWIERRMGRAAWEGVWGPLLRGKFGSRADEPREPHPRTHPAPRVIAATGG